MVCRGTLCIVGGNVSCSKEMMHGRSGAEVCCIRLGRMGRLGVVPSHPALTNRSMARRCPADAGSSASARRKTSTTPPRRRRESGVLVRQCGTSSARQSDPARPPTVRSAPEKRAAEELGSLQIRSIAAVRSAFRQRWLPSQCRAIVTKRE